MGPPKKEVTMSQHNEVSTQPNLSTADRLSGTLYSFMKLYERWSEDRQAFIAEIAKLEAVIQNLSNEVGSFSELELDIPNQIRGSIQQASTQIVQSVRQEARVLMEEKIHSQVERLDQMLGKTERLLRDYGTQTRREKWKISGAAILSGLVVALGVGMLIAKLLMPAPTIPLTNDQYKTLVNGMIYERVWPKLSPDAQADWQQTADKVYKTKGVKH
jgi:hypothetical protein